MGFNSGLKGLISRNSFLMAEQPHSGPVKGKGKGKFYPNTCHEVTAGYYQAWQ